MRFAVLLGIAALAVASGSELYSSDPLARRGVHWFQSRIAWCAGLNGKDVGDKLRKLFENVQSGATPSVDVPHLLARDVGALRPAATRGTPCSARAACFLTVLRPHAEQQRLCAERPSPHSARNKSPWSLVMRRLSGASPSVARSAKRSTSASSRWWTRWVRPLRSIPPRLEHR